MGLNRDPYPRWHLGAFRATLNRVSLGLEIVVCDGDETGQELLEEALRVFDPRVLGFDIELLRYDLSLGNRRATANEVVREAAAAMRRTGLGLKAATITPETTGDVGSPNRILREGVGGSVIVRTGRRIPGWPRRRRWCTRLSSSAWQWATPMEQRSTVRAIPGARQSRRGGPSASIARRAARWRSSRSARLPPWRRACTAVRNGPSPRSTRGC